MVNSAWEKITTIFGICIPIKTDDLHIFRKPPVIVVNLAAYHAPTSYTPYVDTQVSTGTSLYPCYHRTRRRDAHALG